MSDRPSPGHRREEEKQEEEEEEEEGISVALTHESLSPTLAMNKVRSPKAGAIVLFAGTTRDNFNGKPVTHLEYTSYPARALRTMRSIARAVKERHSLTAISVVHRLGMVPIGEESILIAVSAPHRQAAWRAGEDALEQCKEKVEVWKLEEFGREGGGAVWRANNMDGTGGKGGGCAGRVSGEEGAGLG